MPDLDLLRRLGDEIMPPPFEELRKTAGRRTRRKAIVATVAAAAVATAVLGAVQAAVGGQHAAPAPIVNQPHHHHRAQHDERPGSRSLTYAEGPTVHYGDQSVTLPDRVVEIDVTDDGVAVRTADDRIWFTDGSGFDQVGVVGEAAYGDQMWGHYVGRMTSGSSGSLVAWLEFPAPHSPEVVVYDTSARRVVVRADPEMPSGTEAGLYSIDAESVYGFTDLTFGEDLWPNWRIDLATGAQTSQELEEYQDILSSRESMARILLISHHPGSEPATFVPFDGLQQFAVRDARVEPQGEQPIFLRDGLTGTDVSFDVPSGYPGTNPVWLVQWLDDDTVVLHSARRDAVDLLECRISTRECSVAVQVSSDAVVSGLG
jgi:hypothetical protein